MIADHGGRLEGKVVLVTGAARRVGRAIAEELAEAGATVAIHFHGARAEAAEIGAKLPRSLVVKADLRTAAGCHALVQAVRTHLGRLDALVNSAAGYVRGPFAYESDETWEEMLSLNLLAPARLLRHALALGCTSCVNIIDVAAYKPWKHHAAYASSKAALMHLTRCLALELAPSVRVNGVAPGTVAFPPEFSEAERASITSRVPLGRIGNPRDVARAVRYLLEEDYLSGVIIPVDGGASLT
jgi:pteridine reductase